MTSKNSFFKSVKQDIEQRIWFPVVFFIINFLILEVQIVSRFDIWQGRTDYVDRTTRYLVNSFFAPGCFFTAVTVCAAVVCALSGFSYMHSARKLDVYHSLPIKRERLFWQQYVYGILYYVVPFLLHMLICVGICAANGVLGGRVLGQVAGFVLVQLLTYLASYAVTIVAVTLTGNLIISVLGSAVLLFYSLLLSLLKSGLMDQFFTTYYETESSLNFPAFTPVHLILKFINAMGQSSNKYFMSTEYIGFYGEMLLMAAIYTVIALLLYKKRPTEAAGRTMVFPITEPVVKTIVVFPASFGFGYLLRSFSSSYYDLKWFVFGCIFGFIIVCPLMEIIFQRDVKAVCKRPLQIVFNGVCVVGVLLLFRFDVFGYDTYIPDADEVESYAVSFNGMPSVSTVNEGSYQYSINHMAITDNESTRKLLEHAAEITRPARKGELADADFEQEYSSLLVKYNLKNGESVWRSYLINFADTEVRQLMGETCDSLEYKLGAYPVLSESHEKNYIGVLLEYPFGFESMQLSEENMQKFVETYQRELMNLKFEEMMTEAPVVDLSFAVADPDQSTISENTTDAVAVRETHIGSDFEYWGEENGYQIYPSFTETLALLEEFGATIVDEIPAEDVICITVEDDSLEVDDDDGLLTKVVDVIYTTADGQTAEIEQILSNVVSHSVAGYLYARQNTEENIYVNIEFYYNGQQQYKSCYLLKDRMPEFLQEDIAEAAQKIMQE